MLREKRERPPPAASRTSRSEYQLNLAASVLSQRDWARGDGSGFRRKEMMNGFLFSISGRDCRMMKSAQSSWARMVLRRKFWTRESRRAEEWKWSSTELRSAARKIRANRNPRLLDDRSGAARREPRTRMAIAAVLRRMSDLLPGTSKKLPGGQIRGGRATHQRGDRRRTRRGGREKKQPQPPQKKKRQSG